VERDRDELGREVAPFHLVQLCCGLAVEALEEEGVCELWLGLAEDGFGRQWQTRVWPGLAIEVLSRPAGSAAPYRPEWRFEGEELRTTLGRLRFNRRMAGAGPEGPADLWAPVP